MGTMRTTKKRSPIIGHVAKLAGASPTAVSFVLNDVVGSGIPAAAGRLEGYKQALDAHGLAFDSSLVRYGDGTADGGAVTQQS